MTSPSENDILEKKFKEDGEYTSSEIFGNSPDKRVSFDRDAVKALSGKKVTLEIRMYDCDVYSVKFS